MSARSQNVVTLSLKNDCHCRNGQFLYHLRVFVTRKRFVCTTSYIVDISAREFFFNDKCGTEFKTAHVNRDIHGLAVWS